MEASQGGEKVKALQQQFKMQTDQRSGTCLKCRQTTVRRKTIIQANRGGKPGTVAVVPYALRERAPSAHRIGGRAGHRGSVVAMLIARALLAKVRPPRLTPREIQDQVDVTRAAVLTAAYAAGRQRQQHAGGEGAYSYSELEKEVAALKPLARKRRAQTALNDQASTGPFHSLFQQ